MMKNLRSIKITAILGLLLLSTFAGLSLSSTAKAAPVIQFGSYVNIIINTTDLNKPLNIDQSVNIPVTVEYWTELPKTYDLLPYPLNNLIYFGRTVGPQQVIHLELANPPDWANMYLANSDIFVDIKANGEKSRGYTNLVISPRIEAPALSQKLTLQATCDSIYRLRGIEEPFAVSVDFTPSFVPTVQISAIEPIRNVGPRQTVEFKINVKNLGNKLTRVTPDVVDPAAGWNAIVNPPALEINPGEQEYFTFSVITPFSFGWHDEVESFEVKFTSEIYPYQTGSAVDTRSIYNTVYNYGFATSGIEIVIATLIILLVIVIIIYTRKYRNK